MKAARTATPPAGTELAPALGSGAMFDHIAKRYDFVNRVLSLGLDLRWRRKAVAALLLGERPRVLDVATGTGDLAIEIARTRPGATVVGLDPSMRMLEVASDKLARRGLGARVSLVVGDAQRLPHQNCEMDAATIAFGIRNVPDRGAALRELARVVRPGGRVVVLELAEPAPLGDASGLARLVRRGFGAIARFHCRHVVPRLGALLSGAREYKYLQRSVAAFPPAAEFAALMRASGLHVVDIVPLTFGACTLFVATPSEDEPQ